MAKPSSLSCHGPLLRLAPRHALLVISIVSLPWFLAVLTQEASQGGATGHVPTLIDELKQQVLLGNINNADELADFAFAADQDVTFKDVDGVLKSVELGAEELEFLKPLENYRRDQRRLLSWPEAKKEALDGLEDALLEPPVKAVKKPWKRNKYLSELTGEKLKKYPRRVFVDVVPSGQRAGGAAAWFQRHYPKKNSVFDVIQLVTEDADQPSNDAPIGVAEWLERNVKEEEYVVVKADAEAVEEVVESGAVRLVDELFLECKNQWTKGTVRSRRAYWQCLALYGKLRDEGVAVHQWWGAK